MGTRNKDHRDKGWAWVVVTGFAISSFLLGGFIKVFGIFFAAFAESFDASASSTSLIIGVRAAVFTIVAPLATVLSERFSPRIVLTVSGLVCSTGCMLAAFAPNMETVIFSTGVLVGTGMSSFFGPVQIAIGQYFNKRKTVAVSIAFIGMALAQIAMAPINVLMLDEYGLRGTMMLYSGFLLNIIVAAALVRPVQPPGEDTDPVEEKEILSKSGKISVLDLASLPELYRSCEVIPKSSPSSDRKSVNLKRLDKNEANYPQIDYVLDDENFKHSRSAKDTQLQLITKDNSNGCDKHRNNGEFIEKKLTIESIEEITTHTKQNCCQRLIRLIGHVLDFSLFKNLRFALYTLSQCTAIVAFGNIPIYLFPRAEDYHISSKESALLLTIMGCTDLLSRILQGIFGDLEKVGPKVLYISGVLFFCISSFTIPFTKNFMEMAIASAFVGFFGSTIIVLHMSILVDLVGLSRLSKAVALSSFMAGIVNAIAPPLLGYIKDVTTSYDYVFFACAGILFFSFLLAVGEVVVKKIQSRRDSQTEKSVTNGP